MMGNRNAPVVQTRLPENWAQMTPEEKRTHRLNNYLSTEGKRFVSPEAEKAYKVRAQRIVDVLNVREPDMVPVNLPIGNLPSAMFGATSHDSFYDPEKVAIAAQKFNEKYGEELEVFVGGGGGSPGRALEILDYKLYFWPGHGIPEDATGWQYIEGEYMTADEYDDLIRDPSDFWIRTYLPRVLGALAPLRMFQPFTNITENVHVMQILNPLATPAMQEMLQKMIDAGKEIQKTSQVMAKYAGGGGLAHGFPMMGSIFCKAPFDTIGDTLRGTQGIMFDMYRHPAKLMKALDVVADLTIANALKSPQFNSAVMAGYPLHKGADGWMSKKQFDTFYWPSLKKVMDALIKEGLIQRHFAEGGMDTRLESINVFPRGFVTWHFDKTDMFRAKKVLGDNCCIQGNVPSSLTISGSPKDVKEYCRKLIEGCGKGGGFILTSGAVGNGARLENLRAMMEAVREYGVYKKKR
ncbi:MAG TPA: uroporphyrinogen decarboxylase family protein [Syntrophales bacterium]|nr:uroporphyrinogen decarboxylase family protein [Syntrophales bacterium]